MLGRWWLPFAFNEQNMPPQGCCQGSGGAPHCSPVPEHWGIPRDVCCHGYMMSPVMGTAPGEPCRDRGHCLWLWEQYQGTHPTTAQSLPLVHAALWPLLSSLLSPLLSPGCAWHSPHAPGKTISLYFFLPWILQISDSSKQREAFSSTTPFHDPALLLKPFSSPPLSISDMVQMERP